MTAIRQGRARAGACARGAASGRTAALVLGAVVTMLVWSPSAFAGTVSVSGSTITYTAGPDETNTVSVSDHDFDPNLGATDHYTFSDSTAPIAPGAGCMAAGSDVTCPVAGITDLHALLGNFDDSFNASDIAGIGFDRQLVEGGDDNDTLVGTVADDTLLGGEGDDYITIFVEGGDDFFDGGGGNDQIVAVGSFFSQHIEGGDGDDLLTGGDSTDTINGGAGDDQLSGGDDADTLNGGADNDTISADPVTDGADLVTGGTGHDLMDYSFRSTPLMVTMDGTAGDGAAGEDDNIGADIEDLTGASGADDLTGNALDNRIVGGGGRDVLNGADGNDNLESGTDDFAADTLNGGGGDDVMQAGEGDDLLNGGSGGDYGNGAGGADTVDGGDGTDLVMGGAGLDTVNGGDGNDIVEGAAPSLVGADGTDELSGGTGNDQLLGGPGNDMLDGGAGADGLNGEAGTDTATYSNRITPVQVSLDASANDGAAKEGDNVAPDVEAVDGGTAGDTLIGDASANHLTGGAGEDYIDGASGGDVLEGGDSADVLRSRNGTADSVVCGSGAFDYVIADAKDKVDPTCAKARVDRGVRQKPRVGRAAVVKRVSGSVQMSPSGIQRLVPLRDTLVLPTHSLIDASKGNIRLLGAAGGGRTQSGQFRGGGFRFTQSRGRTPLTELVLAGGNFSGCVAKRPVVGARRSRQLFGRARGRFRTRGRHSTATVRGTEWLTKDTCSGTLTRVQLGTVVVRDLRKRRTVVLHAGQQYLARPR